MTESHPVAGRDFCVICSPSTVYGERWKAVRELRNAAPAAVALVASEVASEMAKIEAQPDGGHGPEYFEGVDAALAQIRDVIEREKKAWEEKRSKW